MKKILVISDSHRHYDALRRVLWAEADADLVLFLGDGLADVERARQDFPGLGRRLYAVAGNCDQGMPWPQEGLLPVEGALLFYTHGNQYAVGQGLGRLAETALNRGASVALFGHTHVALCQQQGPVLLFNPGSCGESRGPGGPSYGLLTLAEGRVLAHEIKRVPPCGKVLESLPQVGSTNTYLKENAAQFEALGAVYTTNQTAGRGRLGRDWVNAAGKGLYFSLLYKGHVCQPATAALLASLLVADALEQRFGVQVQIKWPNDLLLNGKKLVGILCESFEVQGCRAIVCGIGVNLAQSQWYFRQAGLPYGTSLRLQGVQLEPAKAAPALAAELFRRFQRELPVFCEQGFAPYRAVYKRRCVNLGRPVQFAGGAGTALDVDEAGNLVVETEGGQQRVFSGEVSVKGVYGAKL